MSQLVLSLIAMVVLVYGLAVVATAIDVAVCELRRWLAGAQR